MVVFAIFGILALSNLRGIHEPYGYPLNTSKYCSFNTYEDDGIININAALGYFQDKSDKYGSLFNIGGPFLHMARLAVWSGEKLGLITVFDVPQMYLMYPEQFQRVWVFFGAFKLLFTIFLPAVAYWLCSNHLDRRTGVIAAWLLAVSPFIPVFEQRMKVDSVCLTVGLLSLLFQIQYIKTKALKHLLVAAGLLGLSFSMKLITLPLGFTLALSYVWAWRVHGFGRFGWGRAVSAVGILTAMFLAANPSFGPYFVTWIKDYARYFHSGNELRDQISFQQALTARFSDLAPLLGTAGSFSWAPALAIAAWNAIFNNNRECTCSLVMLLVYLAGYVLFVIAFGPLRFATITYYFYSGAVILTILTAYALAQTMEYFQNQRLSAAAVAVLTLVMVCMSLHDSFQIQMYLAEPTNRQRMHAWIDEHVPKHASIGLPLPESSDVFNYLLRLDPFVRRLVPVGPDGALAGAKSPQYLLRILPPAGEQNFRTEGYAPVAKFDARPDASCVGVETIYQDEGYELLRMSAASSATESSSDGSIESQVGEWLARDVENGFNFFSYHAGKSFPISLEAWRKTGETVLPMPTRAFTGAIRPGGREAVLSFLHEVPPSLLTLWGVKYVLADSNDPEFRTKSLGDERLRLYEKARFRAVADLPDPKGAIGLYGVGGYLGQAFFIPDAPLLLESRTSLLHRMTGRSTIKGYGAFGGADGLAGITALEVSLHVRANTPLDLILKSGQRRISILIEPGEYDLLLPFDLDPQAGEAGYEVNGISGPADFSILSLSARPLTILATPNVSAEGSDFQAAFARADISAPGRIVFALPWHRYWRAHVDGRPVEPQRGLGNTVAVPVPAGRHLVAIHFGR